MKKIIITATLALLTAGALTACQRGTADTFPLGGDGGPVNFAKDFPFDNAGTDASDRRGVQTFKVDAGTFSRLDVSSAFKVVIRQGNRCRVSVKTTAKILDALDIRTEAGVLHIRRKRGTHTFMNGDPTVVYVEAPRLTHVDAGSAATISVPLPIRMKRMTWNLGSAADVAIADATVAHFALHAGSAGDFRLNVKGVEDCKLELGSAADGKATINGKQVTVDAGNAADLDLNADCRTFKLTTGSAADVNVHVKADRCEIRNGNAADLEATVDCKELVVDNRSASDITVSGLADKATITGGGASSVDTSGLNH